ncbi:MAG: DUF499 domain-containing protein [Synechococcaceae cyanobacterium SM2_3_2]|nr:DUF499 domain-containing protein [Synechococcaceae cyanobacterium SM2_3_2]
MKTVKDACELQPNALSIKVSDQVEQLDELIHAEEDGTAFFEKTFITQGMQDLITEGIARLAGYSSQAIFHLKQAMGGGKTHLLVGFGLLAKHPQLRQTYCAGMPYADSFLVASIAAFNGRNNPNHYFWGEIANQLGKGEQFSPFWTSGPKAPDEKDWLNLLNGEQPVLILLDEMPPYFHYLDTQKVGNGTVADIATRAFANLLTAASKKKNICIVVSDLAAAYDTGARLINRALEDARSELGRQERSITPVDLTANEIYEILRKRLFKSLPDRAEIEVVADSYGRKLEEAAKSKTANRGAEAIADEIIATYPFHPRLKNVIALFRENEQFKQTRGLLELISRLLKSVWDRQSNDIFLVGPQHFDLSITQVRDKLSEISEMRDVIAKDLWDSQQSAHAQVIDLQTGREATSQVGSLLLTASLSTAVNAVKGLTREEMVESLISPLAEPSTFLAAFDELERSAWYLHHTPEGRYYFDKQENLTKLLQSLAQDAPQNQIDDLIRHRLQDMFKPVRKTCYSEVLALPKLVDVTDRVRKGRVLIIVSPDSKVLSDELQNFFDGLSQKNNLCVLTGDKTLMGSVEKAARQFYAAQKADGRIPKGHPQRFDLERRQQTYEQDFNSTILNLFDKVLFPIQRSGKPALLAPKVLDMTRDATKPFNGEEQIEKTLITNPLKLYLDVEQEFDAIRDKAQDLLWPDNQEEARWSDVVDRYAEQAGMVWLPPKGLDTLKAIACNRGLWEDFGNGYVTKKPRKKRTSAQIIVDSGPDDHGRVRLRINPQNAGPAPRICWAEDSLVTEVSQVLTDQTLTTTALRVNFLVCDPSNQYETGDPVTWTNKLVLRNELLEENGSRQVRLFVAPRGTIRYSLDGSEPRNGLLYTDPIVIGDQEVLLRAFVEADGLETKSDFRFEAKGQQNVLIDPVKPGRLKAQKGVYKLDSRANTFEGLKQAAEKSATFEGITLTVGQGSQVIQVQVGDVLVDAAFIEALLNKVLEKFPVDTPVTMNFKKASFGSGHDLKAFADKLGLGIQAGDIEQ